MLRPEFASLLDEGQRTRIVDVVTRFVEVLASPMASIDETHTPKLYAKFLHGQLRHVAVTTPQAAAAASASASTSTALAGTSAFASAPTSTASTSSRPHQDSSTLTASPETLHSDPDPDTQETIPPEFLYLPPSLSFSHSTPSAHSSMSSAGSSVPTPGPEQEPDVVTARHRGHHHHDTWPDSSTEGGGGGSGSGSGGSGSRGSNGTAALAVEDGVVDDPMELCENEFLATMQAISSEQWLNSMLMPGFRWPAEEPMPLGQEGELIFGGGGS